LKEDLVEDTLTTQLTIEEKADLENLEGAIKRELGSFIVVGMALEEIRAKGLYREGYKTFRDYCNQKWDMNGRYADRLIAGSQVAENLGPRDPTMTPCEIQPMFEKQVRPLTVLEPNEQRDVWEEAVRSADGWQGLPFPNAGDFSEWRISRRNRRNGVRPSSGQCWAGAVAASWQLGMVPADPWPRGKVTHALYSLGAPFAGRGGAVSGPESRRFIVPGGRSDNILPAGEIFLPTDARAR
jgi:hypothetical protein